MIDQPNNGSLSQHTQPDSTLSAIRDLDARLQAYINPPTLEKTDDRDEAIMQPSPLEPETNPLGKSKKLTTGVQPWRVLFQTGSPDSKVVGLDVQDVSVVGRSDPTDSAIPDLDLATYDAQHHGVSRRHAILLPTPEGLCLMDLDSTNGTWLNGVYLQPGQKYRLRAGDRIEFGRLRLIVRVVGAMLDTGGDGSTTAITRFTPRK